MAVMVLRERKIKLNGGGALTYPCLGGISWTLEKRSGVGGSRSAQNPGVSHGLCVAAVALAERIGLVAYLNAHLDGDAKQCKVSPGIRLLALIMAIMVNPGASYRLEEFYENQDCALLFGAGYQADFNEDAIGRALLKLFDLPSGPIYSGICRQTVDRLALPATDSAHVDATSVTLQGAYAHPDGGARPLRGYNKDGHPESVPLVTGLVTRDDGVPWSVNVMDGNTRDATVVQQAGLTWPGELRTPGLFVADSKW